MSSLEKRIAAVQRKHREELHEEGVCICGWHADRETDYPEHVAAAVVAAQGLEGVDEFEMLLVLNLLKFVREQAARVVGGDHP